MKSFFLRSVALGALLAMSAGPAGAAAVRFTPQGNPPGLAAGETVTFDNITIADFAHIHLDQQLVNVGDTTHFTETGFLQVTQFLLDTVPQATPSLNASTSGYSLYLEFTGVGTVKKESASLIDGSFSAVTYDLIGIKGDAIHFNVTATSATVSIPLTSTRTVLGTGSLINDANNSASLLNFIPSATLDVSFAACTAAGGGLFGHCTANESAFFNGQPDQFNELDGAFTNTRSVTLTSFTGPGSDVGISGGGGNITPAPEPVSMTVLGTGLVGVGLARFRRKSAAV